MSSASNGLGSNQRAAKHHRSRPLSGKAPPFEAPNPFPDHQPICPIDQLPEPLRSVALHLITAKRVPAAIALTDALSAAGAVVHCGFDCQAPDGGVLPATINTCALAPTATGKGRSYGVVFEQFINAKKARVRLARQGTDARDPSLQKRLPRVETLITQAISFRSLMETLDGTGMNMTLQREDGSSLLETDLFKKHTDALTQLWSGNPPLDWQVRGATLEASDARGSVGFRIQPDLMYDYVAKSGRRDREVGWWPRSIVGCHDPKRFPENESYDAPSGRHHAGDYQARVVALIAQINARYDSGDFSRTPICLDFHAMTYMSALEYQMINWAASEYEDIEDAAKRAWENTLRVAVVLQVFCADPRTHVTLDMVKRAWKIVEWSLSQYRWVFVDAPAKHSDKAIAKAEAASKKPVNNWTKGKSTPAKKLRTWQNADFILTCLDRASDRDLLFLSAPLEEVFQLSDISRNSFESALAWLKIEEKVEVFDNDGETRLRRISHRTYMWQRN